MKTQERTWDEIAPSWNDFRTKPSPTVIDFLKDKTGKVLDLGCGSGRNFINNEDRVVYAADFSKEMLRHAKENSDRNKIKAEFIQSETDKLPFGDDFFDGILCWAVMHCIETEIKRKKTISEIYRTLKPGKQALISTWGRGSPRLKDKNKECYVPWIAKIDDKQERYTYIYDMDELKQQVEEVGFEIISIWEERNINIIVKK